MVKKQNMRGFTLIEVLLVLVIISVMIYGAMSFYQQRSLQMRYDRVSTQMQQILNAGLAYYVARGQWPNDMAALESDGYLPANMRNPWGQVYTVYPGAPGSQKVLYVYTKIEVATSKGAYAAGVAISGLLPLSYTSIDHAGTPPDPTKPCVATNTGCTVVASVNIPGYNLNNARAVNFAGLYHSGACVPVPTCPVDPKGIQTTPQVYVTPAQVSGTNDPNSNNVYPISSFTAYAVGPSAAPAGCGIGGAPTVTCDSTTAGEDGRFWRVCLKIVTEKGTIGGGTPPAGWASKQTLLAITRCAITDEKSGSDFTVFDNN